MSISQETSHKLANMSFVCTLLVVFIHIGHWPTAVGTYGWAFWYVIRYVFCIVAVPWFFLASGLLLAQHVDDARWWKRALLKRGKTLVVPYWFWVVFTLIAYNFILIPLHNTLTTDAIVPSAWTLNRLLIILGFSPFSPPANQPLWYVRALMILISISPGIVVAARKKWRWLLPLLFLFYIVINPGHTGGGFWISEKWCHFWRFGFSIEGLFYFSTGIFIGMKAIRIPSRSLSLVLGFGGVATGTMRILLQSRGIEDFGYLIAISIPLVLVGVWSLIPSCSWPSVLIGNSFAIYVLHPMLPIIYDVACQRWLGEFGSTVSGMFFEWFAVVLLAIFCSMGIRKFSPQLAGLIFGGR